MKSFFTVQKQNMQPVPCIFLDASVISLMPKNSELIVSLNSETIIVWGGGVFVEMKQLGVDFGIE